MPEVILARYPQNNTFRRVVAAHVGKDARLSDPAGMISSAAVVPPVMRMTSFAGGSVGAIQWCCVDAKGKGNRFREAVYDESNSGAIQFYSGASQAYSDFQLSPQQMGKLRSLLEQMSSDNAPKSRGDLFLVSFESGGSWQTHIYDKRALPNVVKQVFLLTGQPV